MSYGKVCDHRSMVFDQRRNAAYASAIAAHVTPDSVVLDLGAGLGLHGLLAARAGAARVYLIEPSPVCALAREIAEANGLADRMVFLQAPAEEVELPEKVDLILSVFTGNLLYSEDLLPILFHARDRFLAAGGRLLPDCGELWAVPLMDEALHGDHVAGWSDPVRLQGLDFGPVRRFAANEIQWLEGRTPRGQRLAEPRCVVAVDFTQAMNGDCDGEASFEIRQDGLCHGMLTWIRFRVGDEWLATDPLEPAMHWVNAVLPLDPPLPVTRGEVLELRLQRPTGGDWTWRVSAPGGTRRHSSFLSRLDNRQRLQGALALGTTQDGVAAL